MNYRYIALGYAVYEELAESGIDKYHLHYNYADHKIRQIKCNNIDDRPPGIGQGMVQDYSNKYYQVN